MSSKPQPAPAPKTVTASPQKVAYSAADKAAGIKPKRNAKGQLLPGYSAHPGGDAGRVRRALNLATMRELQLAFNRGGRKAIDKVMKQSPAMFLKMLVLLVPRELEVQHSGSIKAMSDEQLEAAIEALKALIAAGGNAKVINAKALPDGTQTAQEPE